MLTPPPGPQDGDQVAEEAGGDRQHVDPFLRQAFAINV